MSAALTFEALAALRDLHQVCTGMEAEHDGDKPTEEQYQATVAAAAAVLAKVTAQLAIADSVAYGAAMRRDDLNACIAIERRWGLFGYPPEMVSTVLSAVAAGQDLDIAITAYLQPEAVL